LKCSSACCISLFTVCSTERAASSTSERIFLQVGELHLAIDVGLDLGNVALEPAQQVSRGACHARQPLRPDDHERHHADHHQFREPDV
jgi:hypothetical protein